MSPANLSSIRTQEHRQIESERHGAKLKRRAESPLFAPSRSTLPTALPNSPNSPSPLVLPSPLHPASLQLELEQQEKINIENERTHSHTPPLPSQTSPVSGGLSASDAQACRQRLDIQLHHILKQLDDATSKSLQLRLESEARAVLRMLDDLPPETPCPQRLYTPTGEHVVSGRIATEDHKYILKLV